MKKSLRIVSPLFLLVLLLGGCAEKPAATRPPNILFAIADDQSFPHAGAYGEPLFRTPAFDSVAANGALFTQAFVAAPQCSPSRAAILTGRAIWQLEEAGTHSSYFPKKYPVFTDALEAGGYFIGYTGKAWGPGNFADAGWSRNPVGPAYNQRKLEQPPTSGISAIDYAANFNDFLTAKPDDQPFFFWYGGQEPHRTYEIGSGKAAGYSPEKVKVPGFLPPTDEVKQDLLDYALEIEWFDSQLGKMLALLAARGELEHTIIVVTADNGMAYPYAKANLQEFGVHVPLAICGPGITAGERRIGDLVSLIDLAPTFLDLAGVAHFKGITGKSLLSLLQPHPSPDTSRRFVLTGRERHTHARPDNVGYPARAIRTDEYLYILNFTPERWPAGDPPPKNQPRIEGNPDLKPIVEGYEDVDDSPVKSFMLRHRQEFPELFALSFAKRGTDELYAIGEDPYCLNNLSEKADMQAVRARLKKELLQQLTDQQDPRVTGNGEVFDTYPRFGLMRPFEGFKERGKYNGL